MKEPSLSQIYYILALLCFLSVGIYYCYDIPAALNLQLQKYLGTEYSSHQYQINLLYTVYSIPNLILPVIGGFFIDAYGTSSILLMSLGAATFGQLCFTIGIEVKAYWIMLIGRMIFGFGGEMLEVIQTTVTSIWFVNWHLSLALALNLTIGRIGSAVNDMLTPKLAASYGVPSASWFGLAITLISVICGITLIYLMHIYHPPKSTPIILDNNSSQDLSVIEIKSPQRQNGLKKMAALFRHATDFSLPFWILNLILVCYYGVVVPFVHISSDFLQKKYTYLDASKAGELISIPDWVSAFGSPICAIGLDYWIYRRREAMKKQGYSPISFSEDLAVEESYEDEQEESKRLLDLKADVGRFVLPIAGSLVGLVHLMFIYTDIQPAIMLILLGLSYSCFGAILWPTVAYLVPKRQLGTAYGILTISLNIALTVFPLIVAKLRVIASNFDLVLWFFVVLAFLGTVLSVALCWICFRLSLRKQ